jgi:hypothetical protein
MAHYQAFVREGEQWWNYYLFHLALVRDPRASRNNTKGESLCFGVWVRK